MTNEIFWQAVKHNDKRFDGIFFTCVLTTKIFCRPSCSARLPKRKNVQFVKDIESAKTGGFRACLRCKPEMEYMVDPKVTNVTKAFEFIEETETADLKTLANELELSPSHIQRLFKEFIGVSPRKYLEFLKLNRFKGKIQSGSEIVDAMFESGFESSSRLYEKSNENIGMTPGVYKKGGKGMKINFTTTQSELGILLVAATGKGICSVKLGDDAVILADELKREFSNAAMTEDDSILKSFVDAITSSLAQKKQLPDLPLDIKATAFQMTVWEELRKIPFGKTITYAELARRIGNDKAVRAVANACARNSVAIVIPCHRVIGSDGAMRGYRWGIELKRKLLKSENLEVITQKDLFT
jgi:AraC family transcriptional regulator of adaptative response/methylated-DNA-[protein]-cysteine methyltransferase